MFIGSFLKTTIKESTCIFLLQLIMDNQICSCFEEEIRMPFDDDKTIIF